jgi:hypothetical protein
MIGVNQLLACPTKNHCQRAPIPTPMWRRKSRKGAAV